MDLGTKGIFDFGRFTLRISDRVLLGGGKETSLSPRAFELLQYFVTNPGTLVSREQLKVSVWGTANVSDNSIDQKIVELRKIFAQADPDAEYIQNKHGQGWRFVAAVETRTESAEPAPARRKGWSWKVYAAVTAGVAIAAGAVVRMGGVAGSEPQVSGFRQLTNDGLSKGGRLLTDGRLVYFTEYVSHDADSYNRLAAVPMAGGRSRLPGDAGAARVSPRYCRANRRQALL